MITSTWCFHRRHFDETKTTVSIYTQGGVIYEEEVKKVILIATLAMFVAMGGYLVFRYNNPYTVVYTEQYTYTTKDDQEVWLVRLPQIYLKPFLPTNRFYDAHPQRLKMIEQQMRENSAQHFLEYAVNRYNMHLNLDYSIQTDGDQVVVTFMGYGKLRDGTIETIDFKDTYPAFAYDDRTAGAYDYPPDPVIIEVRSWQDPSDVIDRPWPDESPEIHSTP